jgi:hypothetical protein
MKSLSFIGFLRVCFDYTKWRCKDATEREKVSAESTEDDIGKGIANEKFKDTDNKVGNATREQPGRVSKGMK